MTKHLFLCSYNNREAYILLGWDNNRKGFYMIFDYKNGNEESAIYSNLFSKNMYPKTLNRYLDYLSLKNIKLPQQMIDSVLRDGFRKNDDSEVTHVIESGKYRNYQSIDYAIL